MKKTLLGLIAFFVCSTITVTTFGQGFILPTSGPVNRGMAGATTGAPIDAIGSLYWNPATISGLEGSEMAFGFDSLYAAYELSSTFGPNSGSTSAENGAVPIPSIGWVQETSRPNVKIGMGLFGAAGFAVNMPNDPTNPIASSAALGRIQTEAIFFQMAPSVSVAVTDRLSIGGGPVINTAKIPLGVNGFVAPNAGGAYPRGNGTRYHWGLGAQLGFYYVHNECWQFGANVKTPMWFEPFRYFSEDASGLPRVDEIDITLPLILTTGSAYRGIQDTIVTCDVRYLNFSDSDTFGDAAQYEANGRIAGLGWKDQMSIHTGIQRRLNDRLTVRGGYAYITQLFDSEAAFFNLGSDLRWQHLISVGGSLNLTDCSAFSFAYSYMPEWGTTGPWDLPGIGAVPGTSVTTRLLTHVASFGVNVKY